MAPATRTPASCRGCRTQRELEVLAGWPVVPAGAYAGFHVLEQVGLSACPGVLTAEEVQGNASGLNVIIAGR